MVDGVTLDGLLEDEISRTEDQSNLSNTWLPVGQSPNGPLVKVAVPDGKAGLAVSEPGRGEQSNELRRLFDWLLLNSKAVAATDSGD